MALPRMRTAPAYVAECKAEDPQTPVNVHYVRQLIALGVIPYVKAGKKFLINADAVDAYLASGQPGIDEKQEYGKIRRISG
jgi:excisionase family DNA binding protein